MMNAVKISTLFLAISLSLLGSGCVQAPSPIISSTNKLTASSPQSGSTIEEGHCASNNAAVSECFSSPEDLRDAIIEETQTIENNPTNDRYYGEPRPIQFSGHPKAWEFRTLLRQGAARGPNAAGRYTIIPILMTGWGARTWIIDAKTGEILIEDEVASCGWRYSIDSNYIIKNPVEGGCSTVGSPSIWMVEKGKIKNRGSHIFGKPEQY